MATYGDEPAATVARRLDAQRDDLIAEVVALLTSAVPSADNDVRLAALREASITENFVQGVHYLGLGAPDSAVKAPTAAIMYARAAAQRGLPLAAVLRGYRVGNTRFLAAAVECATELDPDLRVPTIQDIVVRAAGWVDMVCEEVAAAYEHERDSWVSRRTVLQQHWLNQILAGGPIDVRRAESTLQYSLDGPHLAAVLWTDTDTPARDAAIAFDRMNSQLATQLDTPGRPLMIPTDEHEVRIWLPVRSPAALDQQQLRFGIESSDTPTYLALGNIAAGHVGFRTSIRQAEQTKTIALSAGTPARRITFYTEIAPIALMSADMTALRSFVHDTLGELGSDDARNIWLRATLREFLSRNRSYVATAEAMTLHRNTVQYRVAQAMELCGRSLDDPAAALHVQLALEACRWMTSTVTTPI